MLNKLKTRLISLLQAAVVAYLAYALFLFFVQRSVLYPGTKIATLRSETDAPPPGIVQVWLSTAAGRTEAWWIPPPMSEPAAAIIFGHGNAELIEHWAAEAKSLSDSGVGVMLVEYPGYGLSEGEPTRATIGGAFTAAYDWLADRPEVDSDRILVMGRSLGGGAVMDLTSVRPVRAVILQSTFTSAASLAFRSFGAPGFLVRDAYDNLGRLRAFDGPILLFHGVRDRVIPFSDGERLSRAREGISFVPLDCGHNDCPPDWAVVVDEIRSFLRENDLI